MREEVEDVVLRHLKACGGHWTRRREVIRDAIDAAYRKGQESMRRRAVEVAEKLDCGNCAAEYGGAIPKDHTDYLKAAEVINTLPIKEEDSEN